MNTFGTRFRLTTYGESHGPAIGGVVDGCPAGIAFDNEQLVAEMTRRHVGTGATSRVEADKVEILSGIYDGHTLGTPIAFEIRNTDVNTKTVPGPEARRERRSSCVRERKMFSS